MRIVELEDQRLTVYVAEGLLDRFAISRIPGIERGGMPLLPHLTLTFRRWDRHSTPCVDTCDAVDKSARPASDTREPGLDHSAQGRERSRDAE